jgi:hypothetical protein
MKYSKQSFFLILCLVFFGTPLSGDTAAWNKLVIENSQIEILGLLNLDPPTCPAFINRTKLTRDVLDYPELMRELKGRSGDAQTSAFLSWDILTKSGSAFAGAAFRDPNSITILKALASDLEDLNLRSFLNTAPTEIVEIGLFRKRVRAWERLYSDLPGHLQPWRADISHLKFLSHPDVDEALTWLKNPVNGKLSIFDDYPDLTPGEIISLNYYTHRGDQINNYYRSGLGSIEPHYQFSDEHVSVYSGFLNNALSKLPEHNIPTGESLYRGTSEYETNLLTSMSRGDEYVPPFYYSSSKDIIVARTRTAAGPSPGNLVIEIEDGVFKGADISAFSRYDEQEVLYRINSKFERGTLVPVDYSVNGIFPEVTLTPKL